MITFPDLMDLNTTETIRKATPAEIADSAWETNGAIDVDGRACYVEGPLYGIKWGDTRFVVWLTDTTNTWAYLTWEFSTGYRHAEPMLLDRQFPKFRQAASHLLADAARDDGRSPHDEDVQEEIDEAIDAAIDRATVGA